VDNGKSGGVLFSSMKKQGEKRTGIPQSQLANEHFNKLRNWLKHYDKTMPEIDAQRDDGVIMILRAYTEFTSAFGEDATTPTMKEFESWFRENALFNLNG
jgi:hemerythrin-like domain-containing protein